MAAIIKINKYKSEVNDKKNSRCDCQKLRLELKNIFHKYRMPPQTLK